MKPWQIGVTALSGIAAFAIAFAVTRSATAKSIGQAPKAPPAPPPTPPKGDAGDIIGGPPAPIPEVRGGPAAPAGSPIPDYALPTFVSGADGSYAFYTPAAAPKNRSDLFLPLNGPMAIGQTIGAVLAFTHAGPKGSNPVTTLIPIEVVVEDVQDTPSSDQKLVTVRSSKSILTSVEDTLVKDVSLPSGTKWKILGWQNLGVPTKAWFDQFSYGE